VVHAMSSRVLGKGVRYFLNGDGMFGSTRRQFMSAMHDLVDS
jgi:hypothetical protein